MLRFNAFVALKESAVVQFQSKRNGSESTIPDDMWELLKDYKVLGFTETETLFSLYALDYGPQTDLEVLDYIVATFPDTTRIMGAWFWNGEQIGPNKYPLAEDLYTFFPPAESNAELGKLPKFFEQSDRILT